MPTQQSSPPRAVVSGRKLRFVLDPFGQVGSGTTRVLLRLMWRVGLLALLAAAMSAAVLMAWRLTSLWGLPRVSEPFDVAAFRMAQVPAERDAFALYPLFGARFQPIGADFWKHPVHGIVRRGLASWPQADANIQSWLVKNREALELWRQAADRPEASLRRPEERDLLEGSPWRAMFVLAQLEASRLETAGDIEGAWGWQCASLRMIRHIQDYDPLHHAADTERQVFPDVLANIRRRAHDPRASTSLLRRALDDALARDVPTTRGSAALKLEYLSVAHRLAKPSNEMVAQAWDDLCSDDDDALWYRHLPLFQESRWFIRNEPERSRRVARYAFKNWITLCERPCTLWPRGTSWSPIAQGGTPLLLLNDAGSLGTPADVAGLTATDLGKWFDSTLFFRRQYNDDLSWKVGSYNSYVVTRLADQSRLIVDLANEMYARDHGGQYPTSAKELVGPYLKSLPEVEF